MTNKNFKPYSDNIIYDMSKDEVLIINLDNGHYYNLSNAAGVIWGLIVHEVNSSMWKSHLEKIFSKKDFPLDKDIDHFIGELLSENLIREENKLNDSLDNLEIFDIKEYEKPALVVFSDIEELLLLDPIHEVDESGWPNENGSED